MKPRYVARPRAGGTGWFVEDIGDGGPRTIGAHGAVEDLQSFSAIEADFVAFALNALADGRSLTAWATADPKSKNESINAGARPVTAYYLGRAQSAYEESRRGYPPNHLVSHEGEPYRGESGTTLCGVRVHVLQRKYDPSAGSVICKRCLKHADPLAVARAS